MKNNLKALMLVVALGFSATAIAGQPEADMEVADEVTEGQPSMFDKGLAIVKPALTPIAVLVAAFIVKPKETSIVVSVPPQPSEEQVSFNRAKNYLSEEAEKSLEDAKMYSKAKLESIVDELASATVAAGAADAAKVAADAAKAGAADAAAKATAKAAAENADKAATSAKDRVAKLETALEAKTKLLGLKISRELYDRLAASEYVKQEGVIEKAQIPDEAAAKAKNIVDEIKNAKENFAKAIAAKDGLKGADAGKDAEKKKEAEEAVRKAQVSLDEALKCLQQYKV